ncbi:MAG: hypothetical protein JWQ79_114 [Mucilaginibacter sp.]|nr:hypothetical protein [Mucilaginibacter sp.]
MKKTFLIGLMISGSCLFKAWGQTTINVHTKAIFTAVDNMRRLLPVEKLYLQTDKPYYNLGDTLRFKAYLLNADFLTPSAQSGLLYIELADALNKVVKRITVPVFAGISFGDIALRSKNIQQGAYTLRAYTNWMRNFGEDYVFKQSIYISPVNRSNTLIQSNFRLENGTDKDHVSAGLHFIGLDGQPLSQKTMLLTVKRGTKTLFEDKANVGTDGSIQLNFDIPAKAQVKNLNILAKNMDKDADTTTLTIPVLINRIENTDVQFIPEGGNMVAGIPAKIGFKAIAESGKGVAVSGKIYNDRQQEITTFRSTHNGIGTFELTPQAGESYTAQVNLTDQLTKTYALPAVDPQGTTLKIIPKGKDSLEIQLAATPELINSATNYYLVGQTRGVICYSAVINFKKPVIKEIVAKDLFASGIVHFTLFNAANRPLNERLVYVDQQDNLQIAINSNKPLYQLRDSVNLLLQVNDKQGKPVKGNFSITVTDDSQVNQDSLSNNIVSNLLLTSDLKGTVEDPAWYFETTAIDRTMALDNLLLTQGWIGYDWKQVFAPPDAPEYEAEKEFRVKGRVSNIFNKSVANTDVMLISTQPELLLDTKTDKNGLFTFKDFPALDTINFRLQTRRGLNIGIMVDEFVPPELTPLKNMPIPWYINNNSTPINYTNKKTIELNEAFDMRKSILLKQVDIKGKNDEKFGPPYLVMDEEDIRNARTGKKPMNLVELLDLKQKLSQNNLMVMVDGQLLTKENIALLTPPIRGEGTTPGGRQADRISNLTGNASAEHYGSVSLMESFTTENIKTISARKTIVPVVKMTPVGPVIIDRVVVLVNITTNIKFGNNAIPPGDYIYRPMPISWPRRFYSPKYIDKDKPAVADRRSTIFWKPDIVTDDSGKATFSFYSADLPGSYTLILEGTDLNGNIGYKRQRIKVGTNITAEK